MVLYYIYIVSFLKRYVLKVNYVVMICKIIIHMLHRASDFDCTVQLRASSHLQFQHLSSIIRVMIFFLLILQMKKNLR